MCRTPLALAALVGGLALAAAGCGGSSSSGGSGGVPDSASLVPATAPVYVYANTDFGGSEWSNLNSLLAKFPDRAQVTTALQKAVEKQGVSWSDIKGALGPDTGIAALNLTGTAQALLMNKPSNQANLDALIQKLDASGTSSTTTQKRTIDGWTVVSGNTASLDASEAASKGTSLADSQTFKDAFSKLPSDALVKFFVDGHAIATAVQARGGTTGGAAAMLTSLKSVAGSVAATDSGISVQAVTTGALGTKAFSPSLASEVPAGALVYLSFSDLGAQVTKLASNPQFKAAMTQLQTGLGVSTADLASLLSGEGAVYVSPGSPLPEVTLVLANGNAQAAVATLDKLTAAASLGLGTTVETVTVGGVQAKKLTVRGIPVYYADVNGKLVITDSEAGITGLTAKGDKLADDPVYKSATKAAGVPSETTGMLYVNIKDTVPLIDSFASIAGQSLPAQATSNLEHVTSFVAYGAVDGDTNTFKAFLEIQ